MDGFRLEIENRERTTNICMVEQIKENLGHYVIGFVSAMPCHIEIPCYIQRHLVDSIKLTTGNGLVFQ